MAIPSVVSNNLQTLGTTDSIDGGAGTDTLTASLSTSATPGLANIENFFVTFNTNAGTTLDMVGANAEASVNNIGSAVASTISNITLGTALTLQDNTAVGGAFAFASATGASDAATLTLNNVTGGAPVTIAAIEQMKIVSSGSVTNNIAPTFANATTLELDGTRALTLTGNLTVPTTITSTNSAGVTLTSALPTVITGTATGGVSITGGAGNDALTLSPGVAARESIVGGAGNDTITFTANLANGDTIDGGADTDTLVGTSANLVALTAQTPATISGIERVTVSDAQGAALVTANIQADIQRVNLALGANGQSVTFDAGTRTLALNAASAGAVIAVDTGTATTDALTILNGSAAANTTNAQNVTLTGFETATINTSTSTTATAQTVGTITMTPDAGGAVALNFVGGNAVSTGVITAASATSGTVNASGLTGAATFTNVGATVGIGSITGSSNDDVIVGSATATSIDGGAGNDNITGGAANDTLVGGLGNDTIASGAGVDNISGGDGNDRVDFVGGDWAATDTIDGGTGVNTINVTGGLADPGDAAFTRTTNVQAVTFGTAAAANAITLGALAGAAGVVTVTGNTGNDTITVTGPYSQSALRINLGAGGIDTVAATANPVDITVSSNAAGLTAADNLAVSPTTGDVLRVVADNGAAVLGAGVTGFDTITVVAGTLGTETVGITTADANVDTGVTMVVNAAALTDTTNTARFTFDGAAETNGNFSVTGGAADDTITTGAGADTIVSGTGADSITAGAGADSVDGGAGADTISGGAGADTLTGGAGNDTFRFVALTDSTMGNSATFTGDVITDFNPGSGTVAGLVDRITLPAGAVVGAVTPVTIGAANLASFQTDLAANTVLTTALANAGNVAIITVSAGTAAGTYLASAVTGGAYNAASTLIARLDNASNLANMITANFSVGTPTVTATYAGTTYTVAGAANGVVNVTAAGAVTEGGAAVTPVGTFNQAAVTQINLAGVTGGLGATVAVTGATSTALAQVTGTGGNDTFTYATAVFGAAASTLTGGNGTDTLVFTTYGTDTVGDAGAGINSIENISLTAGATALTMDNAVNTVVAITNASAAAAAAVVLGTGAAHTFTSASTGADTVTLGLTGQTATFTDSATNNVIKGALAGSTAITSNAAGNTLTVQSAAGNATLAYDSLAANYTGGSGTDILQVITAGTATGNAVTTGTLNSIEKLDLEATAAGVTVTLGTTTGLVTLAGSTANGDMTVKMTAAQLNALTTVTSANANNTFKLQTTDTAAATIDLTDTTFTTAANVDNIDLSSITGGATVTIAGETFGAAAAAKALTLGSGADTLNIVTTAFVSTGGRLLDLGGGADTVNVNVADGIVTATDMDASASTTSILNVNANVTTAALSLNTNMNIFGTVNFTVDQVSGGNAVTINNNATTITAKGGDFILGTGGDSFTTSGTAANIVTDGAGADTITFNNTLGNTVTATGGGINTINLNASNGVADTIKINDGVAGHAIIAAINRSNVTGFATHDVLQLDTFSTTAGAATGSGATLVISNAAGAVNFRSDVENADVLMLNFDMAGGVSVLSGDTTGAALVANVGGSITVKDQDKGYIFAFDGTTGYLYHFVDDATADVTLQGTEIALVGTYTGSAIAVNGLGGANFTIAD